MELSLLLFFLVSLLSSTSELDERTSELDERLKEKGRRREEEKRVILKHIK